MENYPALPPEDEPGAAFASADLSAAAGYRDTDAPTLVADNIKHYIEHVISSAGDGEVTSALREQQMAVFSDVAVFFSSGEGRGSVILPTGSGKTVIMAELANAMYFGTEEQPVRPKTLVLVPNIKLIHQTSGEQDAEGEAVNGFARFAPNVSTSKYGDGKKDISGDVVVMTYQSLRNAVKDKNLPKFDVVMCDEAHRSLGKTTKEAVDFVTQGATTVAFTATPDFNAAKSVRKTFGEVIHELSLREAIDLGMLAPLQVWSYKTDVQLKPPRGSDFTDDELREVAEHVARNQAAVEFVANYVTQGLQGIVSCVPGRNTFYAANMAELLNDTTITDQNGIVRPIVARSVSGMTSQEGLAEIYAGYADGSVDVLTYVDLLTEGWDAPNAKFIVNTRPTTSSVNATQRLGRVLRLFKPDSVAQIVEFIDSVDTDVVTAYHVLGELEMHLNEGNILGDGGVRENGQGATPPNMDAVNALIVTCSHEKIGELYLTASEKAQLQDIKEGKLITMQDALGRIAAMGASASDTWVSNNAGAIYVGRRRYFNPDEIESLRDKLVRSEVEVTEQEIRDIANSKANDRLLQAGVKPERANTAVLLASKYANLPAGISSRDIKTRGTAAIVYDVRDVASIVDDVIYISQKIAEPFAEGTYATIYDYLFKVDDDGNATVAYDRSRYHRAFRELDTALGRMKPQDIADIIRLELGYDDNTGSTKYREAYSRELLATVLGTV